MRIKLTKLLNHCSYEQLVKITQLDPTAIIEVNDGIAEQTLLEIERRVETKGKIQED